MQCLSGLIFHTAACTMDRMAGALAAFLDHKDLGWGKALSNARNPKVRKDKMNIFDLITTLHGKKITQRQQIDLSWFINQNKGSQEFLQTDKEKINDQIEILAIY